MKILYFIKKRHRIQNKWTQTEFGAKIGINSSAISKNRSKVLSKKKLDMLVNLFRYQ